MRRSGY
ncbi:hypothetical protein YPPY53_4382, partial [Yersinia pestis PY-53]